MTTVSPHRTVPTLSALYIYPLKSARGVLLANALAQPRGLAHDRHWAAVDVTGRLITQRECPKLALIQPRIEDGCLSLSLPAGQEQAVPDGHDQDLRPLKLWTEEFGGHDLGDEVADWLSAYLGVPCRLAQLPRRLERWQEGKPYRAPLSFADGNPFHLVGEGSVGAVAQAAPVPVDALTFRPNLVIAGLDAYGEDFWRLIQIGDVRFSVVESCARCGVVNTTTDGQPRAEPLRTLTRLRRTGKNVPLGQHLILAPGQAEGVTLRVGDPVQVLEVGDTPNGFY